VQSISSLESIFFNEDVYVVGGGKSLDYYPESFFDGRRVLAVNQAHRIVQCDFIVRKENGEYYADAPIIASKHVAGCNSTTTNEADYIFEHHNNTLDKIEIEGLHPHGSKIIVSWSTITSAIHLAAYMGARCVFLAGHDCATVDGKQVADGYYDGVKRLTQEQDYSQWLSIIAPQTAFVRDWLQNEYKIPLITLSPFIGLKHEGHQIA
jgi:hypothetical protein